MVKDLENQNEILLIDKPKGITSFDVIRQLRNKMGIKKMGHGGTLDPLATGLMIIGVGKGTKKLAGLIGLDKTYTAEILLGKQTDTGDLDGSVVEEKDVPNLTKEEVEKVLESLVGENELEVSLYSAIKKGGRPLYKYAREGKEIERPKRVMKVYRTKLIDFKDGVVTAEFEVASGVYIRSLGEEVGRRLGTVATLQNLRRTKIGEFKIEDAEQL